MLVCCTASDPVGRSLLCDSSDDDSDMMMVMHVGLLYSFIPSRSLLCDDSDDYDDVDVQLFSQ